MRQLLLDNDERWLQAQNIAKLTTYTYQNARLATECSHPGRFHRRGFPGHAVFDQFNTKHQSLPTRLTNQSATLLETAQFTKRPDTKLSSMHDQIFFAQDLDAGQSRCTR